MDPPAQLQHQPGRERTAARAEELPTDGGHSNFNAQMMNGDSITCNVYVNGAMAKTNTSTGAFAVVSRG